MSRASTPTKPVAPAKTSAPAPSPKMPSVPQEKIAMLAYDKWCKRGCPEGTSMQDWLDAEKELMHECSKGGKK